MKKSTFISASRMHSAGQWKINYTANFMAEGKTSEPPAKEDKSPYIKWTPYRGEIEPVTKILQATMWFKPTHLRIVCGYSFKQLATELLDNGEPEYEGTEEFIKCDLLIPREALEICRTVTTHKLDRRSDQEHCHLIEIFGRRTSFWLFTNDDDATRITDALSKYITQ